jgi:hypothetical protein
LKSLPLRSRLVAGSGQTSISLHPSAALKRVRRYRPAKRKHNRRQPAPRVPSPETVVAADQALLSPPTVLQPVGSDAGPVARYPSDAEIYWRMRHREWSRARSEV